MLLRNQFNHYNFHEQNTMFNFNPTNNLTCTFLPYWSYWSWNIDRVPWDNALPWFGCSESVRGWTPTSLCYTWWWTTRDRNRPACYEPAPGTSQRCSSCCPSSSWWTDVHTPLCLGIFYKIRNLPALQCIDYGKLTFIRVCVCEISARFVRNLSSQIFLVMISLLYVYLLWKSVAVTHLSPVNNKLKLLLVYTICR